MIVWESDRTGAHDWEVKKSHVDKYRAGPDVIMWFNDQSHMGHTVDIIMSPAEARKLIEELSKALG